MWLCVVQGAWMIVGGWESGGCAGGGSPAWSAAPAWGSCRFQCMEGPRFRSRLAVPTGLTHTESLRLVSEALSLLLAACHWHLPALGCAQTPSPLLGWSCWLCRAAAGQALHCILFDLLFGAGLLDSAPECGEGFCLSICTGLNPGTQDA